MGVNIFHLIWNLNMLSQENQINHNQMLISRQIADDTATIIFFNFLIFLEYDNSLKLGIGWNSLLDCVMDKKGVRAKER